MCAMGNLALWCTLKTCCRFEIDCCIVLLPKNRYSGDVNRGIVRPVTAKWKVETGGTRGFCVIHTE